MLKPSQIKLSSLVGITIAVNSADDIMRHHGLRHFSVDVLDDYALGFSNCWRGKYWVLEISTGIIHWSDSLRDCKEWIRICEQGE